MKYLIAILVLTGCLNLAAQEKNFIDQPYIETSAKVDTLVVPDNIYIRIVLNESDSKNKKSTEELDQILHQTLTKLAINTKKDLSLLDYNSSFKKYFLKGQNIVKSKNYMLVVHDAVTAGKVLAELENAGISNVSIDRTEYSKAEELIEYLKSKAVLKAKRSAVSLTKPLNQQPGKALHITEGKNFIQSLQGQVPGLNIRGAASLVNDEPILVDFQKIQFEAQVTVKFVLQ